MISNALVYSENELGQIDGKVANGLVRRSEKYKILGIIDSTKAGFDAGEYLDGVKNGIQVFENLDKAIEKLGFTPKYFIYGIAALASFLEKEQREIILYAMKKGMDIVNGLPEFLTEDEEFIKVATENNVKIYDIRKAPLRKDLHIFTGRIFDIKTPVITVLGTDCAVGKRTTATNLVDALKLAGIKTSFIATGQTGLLQGAKYGVALDVLSSGFATGEVENAILNAIENDNPDIIVVEGQGALSHPAFTSTTSIIRGAVPKAIILQHPPKRINHCDYPLIPMPTLQSEIDMIESYSKAPVIAITLNHEDMTDEELQSTIVEYEYKYELPTTDVLKYGSDKLIEALYEVFPELQKSVKIECQPQE